MFSYQLVMSSTCSFTLSTHGWNLDFSFSLDSIQSEVSLRCEHTSPNTGCHRGQLFPVIDVTNILSRAKSIWTHVPARIVSSAGNFFNYRTVASHYRSRYSQRKSMIRMISKFRQGRIWLSISPHTQLAYLYKYVGHICGVKKNKLRTTWSYIDDWHRVLNASTFLRTQWSLYDNMTSCLSKTCLLRHL